MQPVLVPLGFLFTKPNIQILTQTVPPLIIVKSVHTEALMMIKQQLHALSRDLLHLDNQFRLNPCTNQIFALTHGFQH